MVTRLSDRYLLVSLNSRQPKATRSDASAKKAAVEDMVARGADRNNAQHAVESVIKLYPNKELNEVMTHYHSFNTYHRRITIQYLPGKGVPKLLSIKKQQEHSDKFSRAKLAFEIAKQNFERQYEAMLDGYRIAFGEYFREEDYPSVNSIGSQFAFDIKYLPLADPSSFQLGAFCEEQANALEAELQRGIELSAAEATREYRDRLREALQHAAAKLTGGQGTRLYRSVYTNIEELLNADLNVISSADLDTVIGDAVSQLSVIDKATAGNADQSVRDSAANLAKSIDSKLAGILL